jgi:hypothetical protein
MQTNDHSPDSIYKLSLTGNGVSIDRELDNATALAIVELVIGGVKAHSPSTGSSARPKAKSKRPASKGKSAKDGRRKSISPTIVRDLSLRPKGKPSFVDFAQEKQPSNHFERQAVAIYWLTKVAGIQEGITVDHVNTCYLAAKWKRPAGFENNLRLTATRKGWIDTNDGANIRITVSGEDLVLHDLPVASFHLVSRVRFLDR